MNIKERLNEFLTLKNTFGYAFALKCYSLRLKSFAEYEHFVFDFLEGEFATLIRKYEQLPNAMASESGSKHIWTLWWQGMNQAPEIVKACLKSQQDNMVSDGFQYTIITKDNWNQYIALPVHIMEKVENGKITLTHFSDIIRAELLKQYGGVWIDATVFCNKRIDLEPVSQIYTAKCSPTPKSLTLGRWAGFLIGDKKGSKLFSFMSDAFALYWEKYDSLVAYLLIDYIIAIAYKHFPEVKAEFDSIPANQRALWDMLRRLNQKYDDDVWNRALDGSDFWKLSYKDEFNGGKLVERDSQDDITYWGIINSRWNQE